MSFNQTYINLNSISYTLSQRIILSIILSIICLVGIIGNTIVLIVGIRKQTYKFVTNCYIINLAITDLLFLLISVPLTIYLGLTNQWILSDFLSCYVHIFLAHVLLQTTCYTLAAMSIDRYFYVRSCHRRPRWRKPRNAFFICIFIWIVSIGFVFPYKLFSISIEKSSSTDCSLSDYHPLFASCFFSFISFYIFPLIIITLSYTKLSIYISNLSKTIRKYQNNRIGKRNVSLKRRQITRTLFSLTCAFAICWFPIHLLELLNCKQMLDQFYFKYPTLLDSIRILAHALSYFNSSLNPFLYALFNREFFI